MKPLNLNDKQGVDTMNSQCMRSYKNQNIPQHIEKRLIRESKKLDLNNRYELIAQAVEHIQYKLRNK